MTGSHADAICGARILVVGGAGFVGGNLTRRLIEMGAAKILVVDNLLSADAANVPTHSSVEFVPASITDDRVLFGLADDLDYVFHLATYHGNQSSIADPLADHENNTLTSLKLFNRLSEFRRLKKVVYSSAGCTVAEKTFDQAEATDEEAPVSLYLDSPYQISKIVGELYANYFFHQSGLPAVKARFQNVYGPGEILGAGRWRGTPATVWRNVVPTFVWKAICDQALPVENGGVATRDFIYVDDIVSGLIACAVVGAPAGVYNLASGAETSIIDLAEKVVEIVGLGRIELAPRRQWDRSGKRFGSAAKAARELDFTAGVDLDAGVRRTVSWFRENQALISRCIAQHHRLMSAE